MKTFDVQTIDIEVPAARAHTFIADPLQLPRWTEAFASASRSRAVMRTPSGEIEIALDVQAVADPSTVDWRMTFPDGSVAMAYSRVVALTATRCVYVFVLTPPPVPLEQIEGALAQQSVTLRRELMKLKQVLEG